MSQLPSSKYYATPDKRSVANATPDQFRSRPRPVAPVPTPTTGAASSDKYYREQTPLEKAIASGPPPMPAVTVKVEEKSLSDEEMRQIVYGSEAPSPPAPPAGNAATREILAEEDAKVFATIKAAADAAKEEEEATKQAATPAGDADADDETDSGDVD